MGMTARERSTFVQRTGETHRAFSEQADRAGQVLKCSLETLRSLIENQLGDESCPYCRGPITVSNFGVDLRNPIARGGKMTLRNLAICCEECIAAKGMLDVYEFKELNSLINQWPKPIRKNFLAQLRAGAAAAPTGLPALNSLEWFRGADESSSAAAPAIEAILFPTERQHEVHHDEITMGDAASGGRRPA